MVLKFLILASICICVVLSVKIEISPKEAKAGETESVSIKCLVEGTEAKEIVTLEVSKAGDSVALVTKCDDANCAKASDGIEADGKLEKDATKSSLNLKVNKPTSTHAGEYECSVRYLDKDDKLKDDKAKDTLKVEKMDPGKVEGAVGDLEDRVDKLEKECCKNGGKPAGKASPPKLTAFAVTNNKEYRAIRGTKLALPDVIMQKGPGYDKASGVFTAPWKGLYAFHLTVALDGKESGTILQLKHNNNILFRLYAADKEYDDQTASGIAVFLEKGDQVYSFIEAASGSKLYDNRKYTMFSGHLVTAVEE